MTFVSQSSFFHLYKDRKLIKMVDLHSLKENLHSLQIFIIYLQYLNSLTAFLNVNVTCQTRGESTAAKLSRWKKTLKSVDPCSLYNCSLGTS